jgi:two-component system, OmpR family, sensor histidine kinase TctE
MTPQLSLKRQLLLWLLLPQLVLWLVGSMLAYRIALSYAEKGIDQSLTQSVRSLARQVKPVGSGLLIDFPKAAQAIMEEDPSDRVSYMVSSPPGSFILGNASLPSPPAALQAGLQKSAQVLLYQANAMVASQATTPATPIGAARERVSANPEADNPEGLRPVRVAVMELDYGETDAPQRVRVQVAKSLAVQQRIARELIYDIIVPLLILGAAISALVYGGIVRGLRPLQRLQAQLGDKIGDTGGHKPATALAPIEMRQAPQEVHSLASAVNALLAAVQRSLGQEKRFLNDAAHQLRTPLAGIKTQLDLAMQESDPHALAARLIKVNAGVTRSSHLVHQLLRLARSEAAIELQAIDVAQLAKEVARDAVPATLAAGIDFGYDGEDHLMLLANPLLLGEALHNLIDNAVRYAGSGSTVTLRVRRDANAPQASVVIEVEDNGPGLSPEHRERMFERFYRASDAPGGAGLGLAIVQEIAQRHGGQAIAQAVQPQGLRMQLWLPAKA